MQISVIMDLFARLNYFIKLHFSNLLALLPFIFEYTIIFLCDFIILNLDLL